MPDQWDPNPDPKQGSTKNNNSSSGGMNKDYQKAGSIWKNKAFKDKVKTGTSTGFISWIKDLYQKTTQKTG
ncbi:hypothetical protein LIER_06438 [Lithospermum erythrorhizon]|uniref:Uncharacterized protein n=1 Tax=Lithospermum erythrorhizon TaxID=34254 RepID=A0AAV3P4D5_LITER